jgi:hypothetical protein
VRVVLNLLGFVMIVFTASGRADAQFSVNDTFVAQEDARRVADDFGACVTFRYERAARRIVTEPIGHDELFDRFRSEISGACIEQNEVSGAPVRVFFAYPTVHAVLADNLIKRQFRRSGPVDFSAVPPIAPIPAPPLPDEATMAGMDERERTFALAQHSSQDAWITMQRIGICTARRVPEAVRQVALTQVGSDEERAAIRLLGPEVGGCVPTGVTVRLRPAELRMAVALGYYRLASALPIGAASAGDSE